MKTILSIIFSFILIYCSAQQTRFLDFKSALAQPENVKSLYINNYGKEDFDVNSLKIFVNLNSLELTNFDADVDYTNLFTALAALDQIDTLKLTGCDFTAVPEQIGKLQFLTCLKISQCRRMTVISNELKQLKNLTYLDLSGNYNLITIPDIFDSLENLTVLNLSDNKLNDLPPSICSLPKLEKLSLHFNKLISLPEKIIELKQLKYLSLGSNPLTYLPADFQQLSLEEIYLGENQFKIFPYQIFDISTLRKFGIFGIDVDSLPHSVSKLANLESVSLNFNYKFNWQDVFIKLSKNEKLTQLTIRGYGGGNLPQEISLLQNVSILKVQGFANTSTAIGYFSSMADLTDFELPYYKDTLLPPSIGALRNLKILKLEGCYITSLPETIGQLNLLEELYISKHFDNRVLHLPDEIGNLVNLKILDLSSCNVQCIPKSIGNLKQMRELDLSRNKLTNIPNEIASLTLLENVSFYGNKMTVVPDVFGGMNDLKELHLSNNKIEKVSANIWKLKALEAVLLNGNNIVEFEIPDSVSTSLKQVYLSDNINLKTIPDFFGKLSNLTYLDLECTQVVQLPASLKQNSNLEEIVLSRNLIENRIIFNAKYGGVIEFEEECESLTSLTVNFHDLYGKIGTDIKIKNDSLTLFYYYNYDGRGLDDAYSENIFFTIPALKAIPGTKFILPDSLVKIAISHSSWWDALLPEMKFQYENVEGEISFVRVKKNKIETYVNLYCDGYDDTDRILIDHKTIIFKKKR